MHQDYESRLIRRQKGRSSNDLKSPATSPVKDIYSDRFIPCRSNNCWERNFGLSPESVNPCGCKGRKPNIAIDTYHCLLKNELLGSGINDIKEQVDDQDDFTPSKHGSSNLFTYHISDNSTKAVPSPFSLSPVSSKSQELLLSPKTRKKVFRKVSCIPFKVLDAPKLQDDFYLNLVDWSSKNMLSVSLESRVYLYNVFTSECTLLCDISVNQDAVTSLSWNETGDLLAVGSSKGRIRIWDVAGNTGVSILKGHASRVGVLAWNGNILSSGSKDRLIIQRDIRTSPVKPQRLRGHEQEVCGLKWSPDKKFLASGGNDNKLLIWDKSSISPVQTYTKHVATVKALAWSPHQRGLLASGGGSADHHIRFWNILTGKSLQVVDTGSQVCNLAWSRHETELLSTHGYSENQMVLWHYPSLMEIVDIKGFSHRILYLAVSPDGESVITGGGDEMLRFWNIFNKARSQKTKSALDLFTAIR